MVHGLTTAADLWTTAGIGLAIGAGVSGHIGEQHRIAAGYFCFSVRYFQ